MKNYLKRNKPYLIILHLVLTLICATFSHANSGIVRAMPVKDANILNKLIEKANEAAHKNGEVEEDQITNITFNNVQTYIVPVRSNTGNKRGCYIYSFDRKLNMGQEIALSNLEESESCEIINAVFSCNQTQNQPSGIGILYGKRLGSNHYWFEGTYLILTQTGTLKTDNKLSERLNDIDNVLKAKKKLGCR
jgi:hypothetical protein